MTAAQTLTFGSYNAAFKALRFKVPLILNDIKLLRILHEYSMWWHLIFMVSAACLWHFLLSPTVIELPDFMDLDGSSWTLILELVNFLVKLELRYLHIHGGLCCFDWQFNPVYKWHMIMWKLITNRKWKPWCWASLWQLLWFNDWHVLRSSWLVTSASIVLFVTAKVQL